MDKVYTEQFHKNYNLAVKQLMADHDEFETFKEVADYLNISKHSLYQIINNKQAPTVEQGITICVKGSFNANWLFLNKGERKMELQHVLNQVSKMLKKQKQ